ncbi:uncharacterized protein LOC135350352 [Halichondria panicea]|uniref:uncharacterized protein LOC135350352 n=1 Tax=Halichondria panicea TaxID=6063 RepID=UPI00312B907F
MNLVDNRMGGSHGNYHERQQLDTPTSFKILVIGERECGKSTVICRYLINQFADTPPADDLPLTELTPHTVTVSPHGAVCVVFCELATTPHNLIKREQYQNCNAVIVVVKSLDEDLRATMLLW